MAYTNAATILREDFRDVDDLDGVFSGYDPATGTYDTTSWQYEGWRATPPPGTATCRAPAGTTDGPTAPRARGPRRHPRPRGGPAGPHPAPPPLRVPGAQAPLRPLLPRGRRAGLRRPPGAVPRGLRGRHRQQRPGPDDGLGLLGRAGPSTRWASSTSAAPPSSSSSSATWAGPGAGSWPCGATPASRAPRTSRRCSTCCPATSRCRGSPSHTGLQDYVGNRRRPGPEGLLGQRRRLHGEPAEGVVGRGRHARQRLLLRLPAPADRRPRHVPDGHGHARRQGRGLLAARPEPGRRLGPRQAAAPGHGPSEVARRPGPQPDRVGHVLEGRPRDRHRRAAHRGHRHRGVLPSRRRPRGEGGHLHPDPTDAAVAPQGRRPAGRQPERPPFLLPSRAQDQGAPGRLHRRSGPAAARPGLGLPDRRARASPRPRRCCRRSTAGTSPARRRAGCSTSFNEMEADGSTAGGCWIYTGRLRRRREPGGPAQARRRAVVGRAGMGMGLARQPPHPLQPGVGRPRGPALERAQGPRLVGRGDRSVGRPRRGGLRGGQGPDLPPGRGGRRPGGTGRRRPVHHAGRRQGVALRPGRDRRRPGAGALRAPRVAGPQPPLRASRPIRPAGSTPARRTSRTRRRRNRAPVSSLTSSRPTGSPSTTPPAG